jgi:hypothetical protein
LQGLFLQVVLLCKKAGLVDLKHVAVDGTKVKGNASWSKNKTYAGIKAEEQLLAKEIGDWFSEAAEIDELEDREYGEDNDGQFHVPAQEALERIREAKKELEKRDKERKAARVKADKEAGRSPPKKDDGPPDSSRYNFTDPDSRLLSAGGGLV